MFLGKAPRERSEKHLRWVASLPCIACSGGRMPGPEWMDRGAVSQAHHMLHAQPRARGLKVSDEFVVPLCVRHHDPNHAGSVHHAGNERAWWAGKGIDPLDIAERLWAASVAAGRVRAPKVAA